MQTIYFNESLNKAYKNADKQAGYKHRSAVIFFIIMA